LAVFALWTATVYLHNSKKGAYYLFTMLPACFMTGVTLSFICIDKIGFRLPIEWNWSIGLIGMLGSLFIFYIWKYDHDRKCAIQNK
jgi:carbon starvation protein CstA